MLCILKGEDLHKMHLFDVFRESSYLQFPGFVFFGHEVFQNFFNAKGKLQFGFYACLASCYLKNNHEFTTLEKNSQFFNFSGTIHDL